MLFCKHSRKIRTTLIYHGFLPLQAWLTKRRTPRRRVSGPPGSMILGEIKIEDENIMLFFSFSPWWEKSVTLLIWSQILLLFFGEGCKKSYKAFHLLVGFVLVRCNNSRLVFPSTQKDRLRYTYMNSDIERFERNMAISLMMKKNVLITLDPFLKSNQSTLSPHEYNLWHLLYIFILLSH